VTFSNTHIGDTFLPPLLESLSPSPTGDSRALIIDWS